MKLWILRPIDDMVNRPGTEHPIWSWDCAYGFVVRAESEITARQAIVEARNKDDWRVMAGDEREAVWLDPKLTSCVELTTEGEPGILMRDFLAG